MTISLPDVTHVSPETYIYVRSLSLEWAVNSESCPISEKMIFPEIQLISMHPKHGSTVRSERLIKHKHGYKWFFCFFDRQIRDTLPRLKQDPLSILLGNAHRSLLVQTNTPGVEYRGGQDGVRDGRQALDIKIDRLGDPRVHAARGVNKFLNGNVAISPLAIKMAAFGGRVFHAMQASNEEITTPIMSHESSRGRCGRQGHTY